MDENNFVLVIKKYVTDGLTIATEKIPVAFPAGFSYDKFFSLKIVDDGKNIVYSVNGVKICSIALSETGSAYETDKTGVKYFDKATVYDASGKSVAVVDKTRLRFDDSQIAICTRDSKIAFDNMSLKSIVAPIATTTAAPVATTTAAPVATTTAAPVATTTAAPVATTTAAPAVTTTVAAPTTTATAEASGTTNTSDDSASFILFMAILALASFACALTVYKKKA